jgi:large subunit ribosomal protein L21
MFSFRRLSVYAIIRTGGKQYRVAEGELVRVERGVLKAAADEKVTFSDVLLVGGDQVKVGSPAVGGVSVTATVLRESRGDKVVVFRKKHRKNHAKRKHGHRQDMVELRIDRINV